MQTPVHHSILSLLVDTTNMVKLRYLLASELLQKQECHHFKKLIFNRNIEYPNSGVSVSRIAYSVGYHTKAQSVMSCEK